MRSLDQMPTHRAPCLLILSLAWLGACGDSRPTVLNDAGPRADAGGADAGPRADAGGTDAGAGIDAGGAGCVTDVPCASDAQCITLAGHACNRGLPQPRCQRLECGTEGSPCAEESDFVFDPGPSADAFCASGVCRHPAAGPWTCRAAPLTEPECLAVCAHYQTVLGCSSVDCAQLCGFAFSAEYCPSHGGLTDARPTCGGVGSTLCTDHEYFSF